MVIHGYPWLSMVNHEYPWLNMDSMVNHGFHGWGGGDHLGVRGVGGGGSGAT